MKTKCSYVINRSCEDANPLVSNDHVFVSRATAPAKAHRAGKVRAMRFLNDIFLPVFCGGTLFYSGYELGQKLKNDAILAASQTAFNECMVLNGDPRK
jgi:hypothetical protein